MSNHVQNFSEPQSKKMRNVIGFDTGISFAFAWRLPNSNPIQNKYNPLNSYALGRFPKEKFVNLHNSDT